MDQFKNCVVCGDTIAEKALIIKNKGICQRCEKEIINLRVSDTRYDYVKDKLKILAR